MTPEQIARHEAGHAAMAVTLGVPVRLVALDGTGGRVEYEPHSHTREGAVRRMIIILAGLAESATTAADLPAWPVDPDAGPDEERHDRRLLAELVDRLALDRREYNRVVIHALRLACTADYLRMVEAISGVLDYVPQVNRELLERVITA